MTQIPFNDVGMAGSATEDYTVQTLITGNHPTITTSEVVAAALIASSDFPAYSVVGRDASGELVMATWDADPSNAVAAIGITVNTVKQGATDAHVNVYRDGGFNPDALNWDVSFDTDEKKRLAFEAVQPTIIIRKPTFAEGVA